MDSAIIIYLYLMSLCCFGTAFFLYRQQKRQERKQFENDKRYQYVKTHF